MTALPAATAFTDGAITEAQFKSAITDLRAFLAGLLGSAGDVATAQAALDVLFGAGVDAKTGAYTVVAADRGKLLDCDGTFTLTLTAAATLRAGFVVAVKNSGTGVITIDAAASELIDGELTHKIQPKSSALLACTGTEWLLVGFSVIPFGVVELTTGATIYKSADSEYISYAESYTTPSSYGASESSVWFSAYTFRMEHFGEVTVSFDLARTSDKTAYGRILKNGSVVQEWTSTSSTYSTKTAAVKVAPGDAIEIQSRISDSGTSNNYGVKIRNRRIYITQLTNA